MITAEQAKAFVLLKMLKHGYIGGKHTHIRNISKGKPADDIKMIQSVLEGLIKEGMVYKKPTKDGIHVSLNPRKRRDAYKTLLRIDMVLGGPYKELIEMLFE